MKCSHTLIFAGLIVVVSVLVGCWLRAICAPEWLQPDSSQYPGVLHPWAVEADCYSQLARVQRILHGQGLIQNHFTVENWPEGLTPSTTAPFDYVILLLAAPLALITQYPLDWAGALVSPLLWLGLVGFWMLFRSREFTLTGRVLLVAGSALLPQLIWATAFGRPRHQSLIFLLIAMALTAEYERWSPNSSAKRTWNIFAGAIWGMACWTSLFEPALVVTLLVLFNLITRRRESFDFLVSFGVVMLIALLLEGVHVFVPPPEYHEALVHWWGTIAEVQGIGLIGFVQQLTLLSFPFLVAFLAWRLLARAGDRRSDLFLILLTVLLGLLTAFQKRWMYYASLSELMLIVRYCQVAPTRWTRLVVMAIFLLSVAYDNTVQIQAHAGAAPNQPSPQLAQLARSIDQPGGIMAPWWLSPGLLYFSGQPIVTGSSHCGISGIVAGAKFYTSTSWVEADRILQDRQVHWVVVYDDPGFEYPLLNTARGILGLPFYTEESKGEADATVTQILLTDRFVPTSFHLRAVTSQFKLYEYVP